MGFHRFRRFRGSGFRVSGISIGVRILKARAPKKISGS